MAGRWSETGWTLFRAMRKACRLSLKAENSLQHVMAGLVPATHRGGGKSRTRFEAAWWVAGTSLGHDVGAWKGLARNGKALCLFASRCGYLVPRHDGAPYPDTSQSAHPVSEHLSTLSPDLPLARAAAPQPVRHRIGNTGRVHKPLQSHCNIDIWTKFGHPRPI